MLKEYCERKHTEREAQKSVVCWDYYKSQVRFRNIQNNLVRLSWVWTHMSCILFSLYEISSSIFGCVIQTLFVSLLALQWAHLPDSHRHFKGIGCDGICCLVFWPIFVYQIEVQCKLTVSNQTSYGDLIMFLS